MSSLPALYFADYCIHDILHIQRSFSSFPGETDGKTDLNKVRFRVVDTK